MIPNCFIVGAQKAGTSALCSYLGQHQDVYVADNKEPNFFAFRGRKPSFKGEGDAETINRSTVHCWDAYKQLYQGGKSFRYRCDASTLYLYDKGAAAAIRDTVPDAKVICLLRDPVDRAFSAYCHLRRDNREMLDFEDALERETSRIDSDYEFLWHYKNVGMYWSQVERYLNSFDAKQLLFISYGEFVRNNDNVLNRVLDFLEIVPDVIDTRYKLNLGGLPRFAALNKFLNSDSTAKRLARKMVGDRLGRWLQYKFNRANLKGKPAMVEAVRGELAQFFAGDLARLESEIGLDVSQGGKV